MLRMLLGHPEIWIQLQEVWEIIECTHSAWDSVFNKNTDSVTMKQRYLRDCMRFVGCM